MSVWEKVHLKLNYNGIILDNFHSHELYLCKQRGIHLYECLVIYLPEKKHPSGLELLVFFTLINFFWKILIKNIIYCQTACLWTVYVCTGMWKYMSNFSTVVLATTGISILPRSMLKAKLFNYSASFLSLVGGNSPAHKLRVMAAAKPHLNATYGQHFALTSVYEKRQYIIMSGKLFSSKIMFEL